MNEASSRFWDRVAKVSPGRRELSASAHRTAVAAAPFLSADSAVLDIGCGPGDLTVAIAGTVATVNAIDTSPQMVELAKATAGSAGVDNIRFEVGDLATVATRSEPFQAVTAFNVLPYVADLPAAFRQIGSLLPPGGLFLSATACLGDRISLLRTVTYVLTRLGIMPPTHVFRLRELSQAIADSGFDIVETVALSELPEHFVAARKPG